MTIHTGKQLMLNAYRGIFSERIAIAPEFWYYYPAKLLGVDMIEFEREVPFHQALKVAFDKFDCEGWGAAFCEIPNARATVRLQDTWLDSNTLEVRRTIKTPAGELADTRRYGRDEPSWVIERQIKDLARDLPAWECAALGGNPQDMDCADMIRRWEEVGDSYLLEAWIGFPFFDFFACAREGGFETAIFDFLDPDFNSTLERLQDKYKEQLVQMARLICERTPYESLVIGCSWSCNSLLGPNLWRRWDKPVIKAVADEVHRHGKLLHVHFHGKCMDTIADFAEMGIDCVCPFERPPGGDVNGFAGLQTVEKVLRGRTTMNGNVHTVNTLIRGAAHDVRNEVCEILTAFKDNPRVILGTGDQVGRETPEENLLAMIDEAKKMR
jgi:hypothetical protein